MDAPANRTAAKRAGGWLAGVLLGAACIVSLAGEWKPGVSPEEALRRLALGNLRYMAGQRDYPRQDLARRRETVAEGQHPFAVVVSCSDSRVPVETIFDQGVGDLFVVRVAGNVMAVDEAATVEYGAEHLGATICLILGHSKCGAVTAVAQGAPVHGNLARLVRPIEPAVAKVKAAHAGKKVEELIPHAIRQNVWQQIEGLFQTSPVACELVRTGKLKVVGGFYDLEAGRVEFMGPHPDEARLLRSSESDPSPAPSHH